MRETILEKRYPHSREEDITDAFMRGYEIGKEQEHRWWSAFCANCKDEQTEKGRLMKWIPCKERLPKEYEVLCCDIYWNYIVGHPFADDSTSTGFCAESEGEFLYECIAWMPLPEPYEEREDE